MTGRSRPCAAVGVLSRESQRDANPGPHTQLGPLAVRLPTPEDLIIFKAIAHRPKDLMDIQAIVDSHEDLDEERIERWVREFAQVLEMPELWDDIAPWLQLSGE